MHGEPVRQREKSVGEPRIDRHVRHDPWAVDETGLRSDEQERRLREKCKKRQTSSRRECCKDLLRQGCVQGLPFSWRDAGQHVTEEEPPGGQGKR